MNILIALFFVIFGCKSDVKPLWLSGTWKGTFKDTHTSTDPKTHFVDQPAYPAELRYMVSTNSGTVSYPTLGCTSNWVFLKTNNDTLFFEEKITNDKNRVGCVDKMHYKLLQSNKNEILIIGSGKTSSGSSIETNGVLTKVDYQTKASAKSDTTQLKSTPQNASNDNWGELSDKKSNEAKTKLQLTKPFVISSKEPNTEIKSLNFDNRLVGNWECNHPSSGCTFIWQLKANHAMKYYYNCKYSTDCDEHRWALTDNVFTEIFTNQEVKYKFEWLSNNSFSAIGTSAELVFYRTQNLPICSNDRSGSESSGNSTRCHICEGTGAVLCKDIDGVVFTTNCLTAREKLNCQLSDSPTLKVTCCKCKGFGYIKN